MSNANADMKRGMAENLFLSSQHSASKRHAVLEDDGETAWLYLTSPTEPIFEKDAFVYSRVTPANELNSEEIKRGKAPKITSEYANELSVIRDPSPNDFEFLWAKDGESVAVQCKGKPIAMILSDEKRGYSTGLSKDGPLGNRWNDALFQMYFR